MPLTDNERRALQEHAKAVEEYDAREAAERARLEKPHAARKAKLMNLAQSAAGPADESGGLPVYPTRGHSSEETQKLINIHDRIQADIAAFAQQHKPHLEPWDTPARILKNLDDKEQAVRWKVRELLQRSIMDEGELWKLYVEYRERVLAFVSIAPSVRSDFPPEMDPEIGLQDMRVWCIDAETAGVPFRRPLGKHAGRVYEKLISLPEHVAMTGPEIVNWYESEHGEILDLSSFTKDIVDALRPYGIDNYKRIGYYIPLNKRPKNPL